MVRVALVISFTLLHPVAGSQNPPPRSNSAPKPANADQRGTEASPVVVNVIPTTVRPEDSTRGQQRAEDKEKADWWLVRLTGVLALVGVIQIGVFGLQARRLRETVEEMRDASKITADLAEAAKTQAIAATASANSMEASSHESKRLAGAALLSAEHMGRSVAIQQDVAIKELRAYITIPRAKYPHFSTWVAKGITGQATILNSGRTPAHKVRMSSRVVLRPMGFDARPFLPIDETVGGSSGLLGPSEESMLELQKLDVSEADLLKILAKEVQPYCIGTIRYVDCEGEDRITNFSRYLEIDVDADLLWTFNAAHGNNAS